MCNGDGGKRRDRLALIQPLSQKNQKDIIDSEQLVYLGDDSLCMLTPVHPSAAISLVLILQDAFLIYAACYIH